MKKTLPLIFAAAFMLSGCNGGNGESSKKSPSSTASSAAVTTETAAAAETATAAETTAETTVTAALTENASSAVSTTADTSSLIEAGIVPPDGDDAPVQTEVIAPTDVSVGDGSIELPIIPID